MTPSERADVAIKMFEMNKTLASLRDYIDEAARLTKAAGATDLAFATYFLCDSIAVYQAAMNRYIVGELVGDER